MGHGLNGATAELLELFDALRFHGSIVNVSRSRFADGQYADSIFAAFRCVESKVRDASGLTDEIGQRLMAKAFAVPEPRIQLNRLDDTSKCDEQEGFRFIFMGSMRGIRNQRLMWRFCKMTPIKRWSTSAWLACSSSA